jgi:hypothetical protein
MKRRTKKILMFTCLLSVLLLLTGVIACFLGFIRFTLSPFTSIIDYEKVLLLYLGFAGALFAVIATYEASGAFKTSTEIMETIGSFRDDFKSIMKDMEEFIPAAQESLLIMVPTVFYGFLFRQEMLAQACLDALNHKLEGINRCFNVAEGKEVTFNFKLEIVLVGNLQQDYLKMARDKGDDIFFRYKSGLENFFENVNKIQNLLKMRGYDRNKWPIKIYILKNDPHVRIFIRDLSASVWRNAKAFISFTQSDCKDTTYEAVGFVATRTEMIKAFNMLFDLFQSESKEADVDSQFIDEFTKINEGG